MADYDTFMVFGAVYADLATAESDYEAVKSLYYDWNLIDNFDAAIVAKNDDGKVKIVKKHEQPTRKGAWRGAGLGLATGAVIALFPAAAIGSGLLAATTGGGAALGAIAGHVTKGMNRSDLKDLGEQLDAGESGLVVIAAADVSAKVAAVIENAQEIVSKELQALEAELEKDVKEAEDDAAG
ncbi:DUF1269 domain-containing protein [Ilumatobacter sp.]|uniref:DUF1269 domain-containing protein n=1 Tax=Ilumatobacter sp. TaxID=1967498 RepID=UPI003AF51297